jgi:hypothetical protein
VRRYIPPWKELTIMAHYRGHGDLFVIATNETTGGIVVPLPTAGGWVSANWLVEIEFSPTYLGAGLLFEARLDPTLPWVVLPWYNVATGRFEGSTPIVPSNKVADELLVVIPAHGALEVRCNVGTVTAGEVSATSVILQGASPVSSTVV